MQIESFYYVNSAWSCKQFPKLDSENTLVLFFADKKYMEHSTPIQQLAEFYPQAQIVGCSTAGEIYQDQVLEQSIVVAVIKFEHTQIKVVHEEINNENESYEAGAAIHQKLEANNLRHIFVLSLGHAVNGSDLVSGICEKGGCTAPISGGLAGDGTHFKETWTYSKQKGFSTNHIVAIGFYGKQVEFTCGSAGGWDTFGLEREITKSKDNILYEIDGMPALPFYKEYLGEHAKNLPSSALLFPMAIRKPDDTGEKIVRTILSIDEEKQSLIFAGNMPQGWYAQLMTFTTDRLLEGAKSAAKFAKTKNKAEENLTIAISCVGRKLVLGEGTDEELEAVLSVLPKQTKQIGFYSYGEISPSNQNRCDLHNQTMTLTLIKES